MNKLYIRKECEFMQCVEIHPFKRSKKQCKMKACLIGTAYCTCVIKLNYVAL